MSYVYWYVWLLGYCVVLRIAKAREHESNFVALESVHMSKQNWMKIEDQTSAGECWCPYLQRTCAHAIVYLPPLPK